MESIFNNLMAELGRGTVLIETISGENFTFYTQLKFIINEKKVGDFLANQVVVINDYDMLMKDLNEYVEVAKKFYLEDKEYYELTENGFTKKLILDLFVNASYIDLYDFNNYVKRKSEILKNNLIRETHKVVGKYKDCNINLLIKKNASNLEGPYRAIFYLKRDNEIFRLPLITFGIIDNKAYVYAIQTKELDKSVSLVKEYDRYFRKVNKGIDSEMDIYNVSPNALVALTLFISYLSKKGITEIEAISFMPLRYYGNMQSFFRKATNIEGSIEEKYDYIQSNITNKFLNLLCRYAYHFGCDYDFNNDSMYLYLNNECNLVRDNILYDLYDSIQDSRKR